jgi:molybdopterin-guanine dinucleotide biosynthesis protein A
MRPPPLIPGVSGALVAGGRARRLGGVPKGLLRLEGEPIAARSLRLFATLFDEALIVANDPAPYAALGARVIPDAFPGKGAPGGVHAALAASRSEWVFTAACDMPFLSAEAIRFLAERRAGAPAVVIRWGGRLEGLHALWSKACLAPLEALLRDGDPSLHDLAHAVSARIVEEAAWREVDPEGRGLENVNTPEDAARLGLVHQL